MIRMNRNDCVESQGVLSLNWLFIWTEKRFSVFCDVNIMVIVKHLIFKIESEFAFI